MQRKEGTISRFGRSIRATVPGVAGWETYRGAFANIALFALLALAGEWSVHQIEYLIVYGARFGPVMAAMPHRLYMGEAGILLAVALQCTMLFLAGGLVLAGIERRRLTRVIPVRLRGRLPRIGWSIPVGGVVRSVAVLSALQILVYFVQENVESAYMGAGTPGLSVLLAAQHATVIPLHMLVAACSSLVLWALAGRLRGSIRAVRVARALAAMARPGGRALSRRLPTGTHRSSLKPAFGAHGLRAPPLSV